METTRDISAEELAALRDPGARHGAFDRLVGAGRAARRAWERGPRKLHTCVEAGSAI